MFSPSSYYRSNTFKGNLGQNESTCCGARLAHPILAPISTLYGLGRTLLYLSFKKQNQVDTHKVCQKAQTDCSKGNSTANMTLKAALPEFNHSKCAG